MVVGGASISDYIRVAPPHSFIHAYSFRSLQQLGRYLQYLMHSDEAYNEYHAWRSKYKINTAADIPACQLCEYANRKPSLPAKEKVSLWWNTGTVGKFQPR